MTESQYIQFRVVSNSGQYACAHSQVVLRANHSAEAADT